MLSLEKFKAIYQKFYLPLIVFAAFFSILILYKFLNFQIFINTLELKLFDFRTIIYRALEGKTPDPSIDLLVHNEESNTLFNEYPEFFKSKWSYPRDEWQYILRFLRRSNNKLSLFDVKFSGRDKDPLSDEVFEKELTKSGNVVLAYTMNDSLETIIDPVLSALGKQIESLNANNQANKTTKELKQLKIIEYDKYFYSIMMKNLAVRQNKPSSKLTGYFLEKFIQIPFENFSDLSIKTLACISYYSPEGILKEFLEAAYGVGIINMPYDNQITEVARDNKPLWRFQVSNYFGEHLAIFPVVNTLLLKAKASQENLDANNWKLVDSIKFTSDFWGSTLHLEDREFALTEFGNIYINWRKKESSILTFQANSSVFQTIPLAKIFIYEKIYMLDPFNSTYRLPEEDNLYWQSYYNNIILNPLDEVYYYYLVRNNNYFFAMRNSEKEDWQDIVQSKLNSVNNKIKGDKKVLISSDLNSIATPGSYMTTLLNACEDRNAYSLTNYLNDINYRQKPLNYHYMDYNYRVNYFQSFYNYDVNFKIPGLNQVFIIPEVKNNDFFSRIQVALGLKKYEILNNYVNIREALEEEEIFQAYFDKFNQKFFISPYNFTNHYIILGECTATGDVHSTSISKVYPGPEIVATAMDNYLNDGTPDSRLLRKTHWIIDLLITLLFMTVTVYAMIKSDRLLSNITQLFGLLGAFIFINIFLFITPWIRLWTNMLYPIFFIIMAGIFAIAWRSVVINKEKRQIKSLFGKFVSPQILDAVIENPDILSGNIPRKKEMTVLFSDIRDFTSKSENVEPEELIMQLNDYLTEMVEVIIMNYNGTLDKFMGDAIMAFWGDPLPMKDHAKNAVLAGLAMRQHLELLNKKWEAEGKDIFRIGIGINSGEMIVGQMGSPRLIDYTVIGDNVNVASRVEGLNKQYGTDIIITESTYEYVKDIVEVEELGSTTVKGRTAEVKIYTIIKLKDDAVVNFDKNPELFIDKDIAHS